MNRIAGLLALVLLLAATALGVASTASGNAALAPVWRRAAAFARWGPAPTATPAAPASPTPDTLLPTATPTPVPSPTPTTAVVSRAIFVDQDAQVVHIYENDVEIRRLPCSTGLPEPWKATPSWAGQVGGYIERIHSFGLYADDAWYLFKASGDILIHGAPYTWAEGAKVYQDLDALGHRPSSHGCIRLRPEDARWLTEWNPRGVPIAISPLTRDYP